MNLLFVTISFIFGTYFYACTGEEYIIAGFVCVASMCFLWQKSKKLKNIIIFLFIAALAFGYAAICDYVKNKNSTYFQGQECEISGRIAKIEYSNENTDKVTLNATEITAGYLHLKGNCKVLLYIPRTDEALYSYGDVIKVTAEISDYSSKLSDFDYKHYYASQNINLMGFAEADSVKVLYNDVKWWRITDTAYKIKTFANSVIEKNVPHPQNQILKGMVTGDKSRLPKDVYTEFRQSGIAHIIAVSGMHINIILSILMSFLGIFKIKRRVFSIIFYLASIWLFVLITGVPMSAVRSALMITLYFTANLLRREDSGVYALALSMLIILLFNPFALFDVGLQLSAGATLSLLLFAEPFNKVISKIIPLKISRIISASLAAQLGTIPICIMEFSSVSLISLVTNCAIWMLIPVVMWSGVLLIVASFFPLLTALLSLCVTAITAVIRFMAQFLSNLPFAVLNLNKPDSVDILIFFMIMSLVYFIIKGKKSLAVISSAITLLIILINFTAGIIFPSINVTFLNTKGAGGALIESGKTAVLIDGGGTPYSYTPENEIIEYLKQKGIKHVNAFITKPDIERCASYKKLIEEGYIEKLFIGENSEGSYKKEIMECVAKNNIETVFVKNYHAYYFDEIKITVTENCEFNNYTLKFGKKKLMFAGGIPKEITPYIYKCDILFMSKGESNHENSELFVMEAAPLAVVTSDSKRNYNLDDLKFINPQKSGKVCMKFNKNQLIKLTLKREE